MILLLSTGIGLTLGYVVYLYNNNHYKYEDIKVKYIKDQNKLYFYCDDLQEEMRRKMIIDSIEEEKLKKFLKDIELSKEQNKNKFKKIFNLIDTKNHFIYWVLDEGLTFVNYKIIILDLNSIYDYQKKEFINKEYLDNLSLLLHKHGIIFVIVSELHPNEFEKNNLKYFNMANYVSPYHYKNTGWSGNGIDRLPEKKISTKAASITINKIILDVLNRYGSDLKSILYIGKNEIPNVDCHIHSSDK